MLVVSAVHVLLHAKERWQLSYCLVFTQSLFLPALASVAVVWWNDSGPVPTSHINPPTVAVFLWLLLSLCPFILGGYLIYRMKRARFFSVSYFALNQWVLLHVSFIVSCAIYSSWL
jgi:hypothetical protein